MASNHEPERASFLGLAIETRLQIYSYLLISYNTPEDSQSLRDRTHCCAYPHLRKRYHLSHGDDKVDVACDCKTKNLHPSILRTNKQVFNEAAQMLYENMEVHVRLPHLITWRDSPLQNVIDALPTYSHKWIRRMVIVGTPGQVSELHRDPGRMTRRFPMEQYADTILTTFPNLRHVRLHVDFGSSKNGRRTAVESFGYIMGVPKLESLVVEVDGGGMFGGTGSWARIMSERIVEFVVKARRCYKKEDSVVVREVLIESEMTRGLSRMH